MTLPIRKGPILEGLQFGDISVDGQFMWGSNYTLLCQVTHKDQKLNAVYKPTRGEQPLWDFPTESLAGREVAAYLISEALGWGFVPPTIYRIDGPTGPGSLQLYIEHDSERHYFKFTDEERQKLRKIALFDVIVNNTDRKGGHVLIDLTQEDKFWVIDHGICFHAQPKLRTVIWDFADETLSDHACEIISKLREQILPSTPLHTQLSAFLSEIEIIAMIGRIDKLTKSGIFPSPTDKRYSYPWPAV
ncbi:MAG: SCO1664 family protein [Chloroflexota bacterium]